MPEVSRYINNTPFSKLREVFNKAAGHDDWARFTLGEPNFDTPPHVLEAAHKAALEGHTHYVHNSGIIELRRALADKFREDNGVVYDPDCEIMVGNGGTGVLFLAYQTLIEVGDEVIIPGPFWGPHHTHARLAYGVPKVVRVYEENGFMYRPEDLRAAITQDTKVILLNSPANPTGGMADRALLQEIAQIAIEHDLWVISDEVYEKLVYDGNKHESIASLPGMKERTVIINSFSKSYAMTGWRIGYCAGPENIIGNMVKLQEVEASCVNAPTQFGAIAALKGDQSHLHMMVSEYAKRRKMIVDGLNSIKGISCLPPKGAFYAFPNVTGANMPTDVLCDRLMDEAGLVVVPGSAFGEYGEGFVRMSFAVTEETITDGLNRLDMFMNKLLK